MDVCRCPDPKRAKTICDYIVAHACEDLTLERASKELNLTEATIRRDVKRMWSMGFREAMERERVAYALAILRAEPDIKIEALAPAAGWKGRSNFYAAVERVTGFSLPQHRALARGKSLRGAQISAGAA